MVTPSRMATLAEILCELAHCQSVFHDSAFSPEVQQKTLKAIAVKIMGMQKVDLGIATELMTSIKGIGLPEDDRQTLEKAVNQRLTKPGKQQVDQQLLLHPLSYYTKQDWIEMCNPSADPATVSGVLARRVAKLGIRSFDEKTYKMLLTVLLAVTLEKNHGRWPKYRQIFQWLHEFKQDYGCLKTPFPYEKLKEFPPVPSLLPQEIFDFAYSEGDPPITKDIPKFVELSKHIPLRKNSDLLVKERLAETRHRPNASPHVFDPPRHAEFADTCHQTQWQALSDHEVFGGTQRPSARHSAIPHASQHDQFVFHGRAKQDLDQQGAYPHMAQHGPHMAQHGPAPSDAPSSSANIPPQTEVFGGGFPAASAFKPMSATGREPPAMKSEQHDLEATAEEAEEATYAALQRRSESKKSAKVQKKPASKAAPAGSDDEGSGHGLPEPDISGDECSDEADAPKPVAPMKAMKRPAAAGVVDSRKRPALDPKGLGSALPIGYKIPELTKKIATKTTWKIWGSTVYHGAGNAARHAGCHDVAKKEFARKQYKIAGDRWVRVVGKKS